MHSSSSMPRALGAIRREHPEAFFVALGAMGNAPATISILFRALRPFWRRLVEEDEIERIPMERMRAPSVPLNPPPVLSDDQSALLLAACRGTDLIARRAGLASGSLLWMPSRSSPQLAVASRWRSGSKAAASRLPGGGHAFRQLCDPGLDPDYRWRLRRGCRGDDPSQRRSRRVGRRCWPAWSWQAGSSARSSSSLGMAS